MGHARTSSVVALGVEGHLVDVEAHLSAGLPAMSIVGLPDTAVGESRDRARSAVINSGLSWPSARLTVGLSPAWLPKSGPGLDLAIALTVLAADGSLPVEGIARSIVVGELALDGRVRAVRGALVAAITAAQRGAPALIVPRGNAREAALVPGVDVVGVSCLAELVARLRGESSEEHELPHDDDEDRATSRRSVESAPDLVDVRGHRAGREALVIAAAGGHHLALVGPPGVGKTLLAERLPGILPDLDDERALEVTAIHSIAGRLEGASGLVRRPPLIAPHHSATFGAMVGGGSGRAPRVGLVSLAHHGVLFLDEAPEFAPQVLDALRQPVESGRITVSRVGFSADLPARVQLVLAANPCACGRAGDALTSDRCTCAPAQRRRYLSRVSGPLLDRIDARVRLERPTVAELSELAEPGEGSNAAAQRVLVARERSNRRLCATPWRTNAEVPGSELRAHFRPAPDGGAVLRALLRDPTVSARGADRVLRLAWTVADLAGADRPGREHMETAADLRGGGWEVT